METIKFSGITVDRCTRCRGIFCDVKEYLALKHLRGAAALDIGSGELGRDMDEKPNAPCPRCAVAMRRIADPESHLTFEQCPTCRGVFFDAGEFREFKFGGTEEHFRDLFGESGVNEKP